MIFYATHLDPVMACYDTSCSYNGTRQVPAWMSWPIERVRRATLAQNPLTHRDGGLC